MVRTKQMVKRSGGKARVKFSQQQKSGSVGDFLDQLQSSHDKKTNNVGMISKFQPLNNGLTPKQLKKGICIKKPWRFRPGQVD